jgi:hypothetical protein
MGSFGMYTKKGQTPDLHLPAKSRQMFFSVGLTYFVQAARSLMVKVEAGAVDVAYKEEALDTTVSGSKLGFQAEAGLLVLGEVLFTGVNLGYTYASGMVGDVKAKFGGARASLCVGVRI